MKDSSVFPGSEFSNPTNYDRDSSEYDIKTDFKEFLEEAKKYKKMQQAIEGNRKWQVGSSGVKKGIKSLKNAFLSIWRSTSKKAKNQSNEAPNPRGNVSGPIHGGVGGGAPVQWRRLTASGPLATLYHQMKRNGQEDETPYVSLERLNEPPYEAKSYGPVYSVS